MLSTPGRAAAGHATPADDPPAPRCAWCAHALDPASGRRSERLHCPACGSDTTWPTPTAEELDRAYAEWYRPEAGRFSGPGDALLSRLRGRLAGRLDRRAPAGPILDVGAGDGSLLDALVARGRTARGLERRSTRPDVDDAELRDVEGEWAAIVFWHSLEHLCDAGAVLAEVPRLLAPGGIVVIAMPNLDSLQARAFGDRWLALDLPRHLVHVPAPALVARLLELGLRPERISQLRGGQVVFGWLHGLVGTLPGHPDLYDAIRRPEARQRPLGPVARFGVLAAAVAALPVALVATAVEGLLGRGGTIYVEARRG